MSANLKSGSRTRYDRDRAWITAGLGGPVVKDKLFFYASYYRPTVERANQANSYGELPDYTSTRNEGFGKLTFTPTSKVLLNASYRYSKRLEVSDQFAVNSAPTSGSGAEALQKIFTADGSWVISSRSYATFKYTNFANPTGGRPDSISTATPAIAVGTRLDVNALDTLGRFVVPTPIAGDEACQRHHPASLQRGGNARTTLHHPAHHLIAQHAGQRRGLEVEAAHGHHIGVVDAEALGPDEDLTGPGLRIGDLREPQAALGITVPMK